MVRTPILLASILSLPLVGLSSCKSTHEQGAQKHESHEGSETAEAEEQENEAHEGQLPAQPATSITAAIATAQASAPAAQFLSADLDVQDGKDCYIVWLLGAGALHQVAVDAADGKLLGAEERKLGEEEQQQISAVLGATPVVGIEQAISAALAKLPGSWARDACCSQDQGKSTYVVLLVCAGGPKLAILSAQDGKLLELRDPGEEDEEEEGGESPKSR